MEPINLDPYEIEQNPLIRLYEEVPTDEELNFSSANNFLEEEENINTDTEEELNEEKIIEGTIQEKVLDEGRRLYYISKDGCRKWRKFPLPKRGKTRSKNICIFLPGPSGNARNVKTPLECWNYFFNLGSPLFTGSVNKIVKKACEETELYLKHDIDGILVENMHDIPYVQSKYFGPEVTSTMARICTELRKIIPENKPFGVQVLACGNKEALSIAKACNMNFIRCEGFVFSHIADEGFTDANAGLILRYRKEIQAEDVLVFTDIKKKHSSHVITQDVSLLETAKAAEYFLSDGVILTGSATGQAADIQELQELKSNIELPVLIGSGVTLNNVEEYLCADALIIGSYLKKDGTWKNDLEEKKLDTFMKKMRSL